MRIIYEDVVGTLIVVHASSLGNIENTLAITDYAILDREVNNNRLPKYVVDKIKTESEFKLSVEDYKSIIWLQLIPSNAINPVEIDDNYVLPDREFRGAWKQNGTIVEHDLIKAKNIQLERIRAAREPKLAKLDRDYMRADEIGDIASKQAVATEKQALRDITEKLKALTPSSIEEIKAATASFEEF